MAGNSLGKKCLSELKEDKSVFLFLLAKEKGEKDLKQLAENYFSTNQSKSIKYFQISNSRTQIRSYFSKACDLLSGEKDEQDKRRGVEMLHILSDCGHFGACSKLSDLFKSGIIFPKDETKANLFDSLTKEFSIAHNDKRMCQKLGNRYLFGDGVPKDDQMALFYFIKGDHKDSILPLIDSHFKVDKTNEKGANDEEEI